MQIEKIIVDPLADAKLATKYFQRAKAAYDEGELKICIVYLRKVKDWDQAGIEILVESAYRLWKQSYDHGGEEEDLQETIQSAFTLLLNGSVPFHLLSPSDYLRLAHIYIAEGNLSGAFQILTLATARGHLESVPIVLAMWSLLTRLDREKDANDCMNFLTTAVTIESSTMQSDPVNSRGLPLLASAGIPLHFVFMHVANHAMQLALATSPNSAHRIKAMKLVHALLMECYLLATGNKMDKLPSLLTWFNESKLWLDIAKGCEGTPFLLLGEDSYWEAYRRLPIASEALAGLIASMERHKRTDTVPSLLARAIVLNPWNIYCRDSLKYYEKQRVADARHHQWNDLFDSEEAELTKIQAAVRGFQLRQRWPEIRYRLLEILDAFHSRLATADELYARYWQHCLQMLCARWRENAIYQIRLKRWAAIKVQTLMRKILAGLRVRRIQERIRAANGKYLSLVLTVFNRRRSHVLHHWYDGHRLMVKRRAATILSDVIWLHGYNQYLVKGMNDVMKVLRVRYRYLKARMLAYWQMRFRQMKLKHAHTTIRFFVRGTYQRIAERVQEVKLAGVEAVVAEQQEVMFQAKAYYILKDMWLRWRKKYMMRVSEKAVLRMILAIQLAHHRKVAQRKVLRKRARIECQRAFLIKHDFMQKLAIFTTWKRNYSVRFIQRAFRCSVARKVLRRLQGIEAGVRKQLARHHYEFRKVYFKRYLKFIFLSRRERLRAILKIIMVMKKHTFRTRMRVMVKRRIRYITWARFLHALHAHHCFWRFRRATVDQTKFKAVIRVFHAMKKGKVQHVFDQLFDQGNDQSMIRKLEELLINQRIGKCFYLGAHNSVAILSPDQEDSLKRNPGVKHPRPQSADRKVANWEVIVQPQRYLLDLARWPILKAFRCWMASYRMSQHYRRGDANELANEIMHNIVQRLAFRRSKVVLLQPILRGYLARKRYPRRVAQARRRQEYVLMKTETRLNSLFKRMLLIASKRHHARLILQRALRVCRAKMVLAERKRVDQVLTSCEHQLNCSSMQQLVCRKSLVHWRNAFVKKTIDMIRDASFDFDQHLRSMRSASNWSADDRESEDGSESDSDFKWKQINKYQKKLQTKSKITPNRIIPSKRLHLKATTHFPSSSAMFFQSDAFHRTFAQLRASNMFILGTAVVGQLAAQEVQYCLFHAEAVLVHEVDKALLKLVCEFFKGKKIILSNGQLSDKLVDELLVDLLTHRNLLDSVPVDRSKWPLTLPRGAHEMINRDAIYANQSKGLSVCFQSVRFSLQSVLRIASNMHKHGEQSALQKRLDQYDQRNIDSPLPLTNLLLDVDTFGWTGISVLVHSLQACNSLLMLTIEHSEDGDKNVPMCFEGAFSSLSKHTALQVMVLRGWYPVSIYYHLAGLLQKPENFPMMERLELQQGYQQSKDTDSKQELERVTAVELLVHLAKMRAYSSSMVGLSVIADFI